MGACGGMVAVGDLPASLKPPGELPHDQPDPGVVVEICPRCENRCLIPFLGVWGSETDSPEFFSESSMGGLSHCVEFSLLCSGDSKPFIF